MFVEEAGSCLEDETLKFLKLGCQVTEAVASRLSVMLGDVKLR